MESLSPLLIRVSSLSVNGSILRFAAIPFSLKASLLTMWILSDTIAAFTSGRSSIYVVTNSFMKALTIVSGSPSVAETFLISGISIESSFSSVSVFDSSGALSMVSSLSSASKKSGSPFFKASVSGSIFRPISGASSGFSEGLFSSVTVSKSGISGSSFFGSVSPNSKSTISSGLSFRTAVSTFCSDGSIVSPVLSEDKEKSNSFNSSSLISSCFKKGSGLFSGSLSGNAAKPVSAWASAKASSRIFSSKAVSAEGRLSSKSSIAEAEPSVSLRFTNSIW